MRDFIAESALYLFKYLFPCCRSCSIMPYKCGQKPDGGAGTSVGSAARMSASITAPTRFQNVEGVRTVNS